MNLLLKYLSSKLKQHICPILHELADCVQRPAAQLDLHALERVVARAKKKRGNSSESSRQFQSIRCYSSDSKHRCIAGCRKDEGLETATWA
jgi:hypothetical protein